MVSIMRYIPLQALNFSFNDFYISLLSRYFNAEIPEQRTEMKFIAGGLAGASSLFLVFPLDFCQTKIITDIGTGTWNQIYLGYCFYFPQISEKSIQVEKIQNRELLTKFSTKWCHCCKNFFNVLISIILSNDTWYLFYIYSKFALRECKGIITAWHHFWEENWRTVTN